MPIRLRITLWTTGVLLLSLLGLSTGAYYMMSHNLRQEMDTRLKNVYTNYAADPGSIVPLPNGRFQFNSEPDPFASSGVYIQLAYPSGKVGLASENLGSTEIPIPSDAVTRNGSFGTLYYNTEVNGQPIRVFSGPIV